MLQTCEFLLCHFQSMLLLNYVLKERLPMLKDWRRHVGSRGIEMVPNAEGLGEGMWVA